MSPLLGAREALGWSRAVPRDLLTESAGRADTGAAAAHRIAGAVDLRPEAEPQVDVIVFGDFDPRRDKPC